MQLQLLRSEIDGWMVERDGLLARLSDEPELAGRVVELETAIMDRKKQLQSIQNDISQLTIYAKADGTLYEPTWSDPKPPETDRLEGWSGNPLSVKNVGGMYEQGTLLCWIVPECAWKLDGYVPESEVTKISENAAVRIQLDRDPFGPFDGCVARIDAQPLGQLPELLADDHRLPIAGTNGVADLTEMCYRVIIETEGMPEQIALRALCTIRIEVEPQSIMQRLREYVRRNLRG